jgi:heterotetrameric sarcosine oxidase gamma subunit
VAPPPPVAVVDGWQVSTHRAAAPLRVADHTALPKTGIRAPRDGGLAALLPPCGRTARLDGGALACGFGPGEWMILGPAPSSAPASKDWLRDLATGHDEHVTVLDETHGRVVLRLTGDHAPEALARICAIDLHDSVTPDRTALRTQMAALTTDLVRDDVAGTRSYLLGCEWSSGQYLFDEVLAAGAEFDIAVEGFHP